MFRFASPWFLLLLILPWLWLLVHTVKSTKRFSFKWLPKPSGHTIRVSSLTGTSHVPFSFAVMGARLMPLVKVLGLSLMILALARPQAGERKINVDTEGINIVLALDLSGSMKALDFKRDDKIVTRLDAVKGVISDFIMKREGDRIGLVVFGTHAFTQVPLTRDYNTIAFMLDHLKIGAAGPNTAIGDAMGISLKRLEDIPAKSNIIILLTDGKSNAGELSWQEAAKIAAQKKIKIHTIGVGSTGKAPFLVDGLFGQQYVYRQVDMDWDALDAIAKQTGGTFFKAKDTDSLASIYKMIDSMEKTTVKVDKWVDYRELYTLFLIPGLLLYLTCLGLGSTRLLELP
ncbi:VWA domain-containing protein [Desulfobacter postgatei]|uniref:Mg-chelatase subunit ChlD n=1 Tax=Desulfobacter postgatei 2ac9 TaxID=879212 RepID=I5B6N7_9BACT|nr:VWA domain-containing protein [Desulfobacter postgatei]EIM65150.1 Mg-chelatase subunit ChlD [Desulfobacter postgatei 2ac9]